VPQMALQPADGTHAPNSGSVMLTLPAAHVHMQSDAQAWAAAATVLTLLLLVALLMRAMHWS
jgi:hypothetical protein